ncbi:uncharacterized protein [Panulirus ornatus]|uniref:uncharacterized protein n=1 Tax=Panulirus ornatus TaxID=150431 RepID=UPI003A8BF28D
MFSNTKINSLVAFKKSNATIHKTKTLTLASARQTTARLTSAAPPHTNGGSRTAKSLSRRHDDSAPPKVEKSGQGGGNDNGGNSVTTFVAALTERTAFKGRRERESLFNNKTSTNRADRLQVTLNMLELEMGRLQQKEKQLEQRLSRFMVQRSSLASTIDDLHLRLDTLACNHKSLATKDSPTRKL